MYLEFFLFKSKFTNSSPIAFNPNYNAFTISHAGLFFFFFFSLRLPRSSLTLPAQDQFLSLSTTLGRKHMGELCDYLSGKAALLFYNKLKPQTLN